MGGACKAIKAGRSKPRSTARVWDRFIRLFHWSLVIIVSIALFTGFLAPEWWLDIHIFAGYGLAVLLIFRIAWGFGGSAYARFSSFLFGLPEVIAHLRSVFQGRPTHYSGHNPAGAWMIFGLLVILSALVITGLIVQGGQEKQGMLAGIVTYGSGALAGEVHEFLAILLIVGICGHICGVLAESLLSGENLVRAMITGKKRLGTAGAHLRPDIWLNSRRDSILAIGAACLVVGAGALMLARVPSGGQIKMPKNATYVSECAECHHAYHPSLMPAASWDLMMAGLAEHFGEDASLDDQTSEEIRAYLLAYAAGRWDTEAANNLRRILASDPLRITSTPYWKRRHKHILDVTFTLKSVRTKANCIACHKDAETGQYADQMIQLPISGDAKPKGDNR